MWTFHSGQICIAPTRLFVQQGLHGEFVERTAKFAGVLPVGDPLDRRTVVGPVISAAHREGIEAHTRSGGDEGAEIVAGGGRPTGIDRGFCVEPTLLAGGHNDMTVAREEIFGPVIAAIPFDDEEEGVTLADDSEFGLHGCIWSGDEALALRVAKALRTGGGFLPRGRIETLL